MTAVRISKHSLFRLKITVGCRLRAYPSIHVETLEIKVGSRWCCVARGVRLCVCVVSVRVHLVWWRVCMYMWRGVYMLWCGVVLCGVVRCGAPCGKPSVCRFKTPPCVRSRRLRVYPENARMFNTCARFPGTHGGVLNAHTEAF